MHDFWIWLAFIFTAEFSKDFLSALAHFINVSKYGAVLVESNIYKKTLLKIWNTWIAHAYV